jgi:hypothetical protein
MSILSVIVPYACPVFNIGFEYPELLLLLLIAYMCSLYLVWNVRPDDLYISTDNLGISFCKLHFFHICLFWGGALVCFLLCFVFCMLSLFVFL